MLLKSGFGLHRLPLKTKIRFWLLTARPRCQVAEMKVQANSCFIKDKSHKYNLFPFLYCK